MSYLKARQVEPGIWLLARSPEKLSEIREIEEKAEKERDPQKRDRILSRILRGPYLAETNYRDPETWQRVRRRKTFNRLDLATSWRRKMLDDEERPKLLATYGQRPITFAEFVPEYLEIWRRDRKESTVRGEERRIQSSLLPVFGDRPLRAIHRKDIESFLARRRDQGASLATANRDLCRMKNILRKAEEWGIIASNPASGIRQVREQIVAQDYLSVDEVENLIEASDERIRPLLVTAVYTGMRWGELMGLEWRDVNFQLGTIHVRDPKNHEDRHTPMNPVVIDVLAPLKPDVREWDMKPVFVNPATGKPWNDIRKPLRAALKRAGIDRHFPIKNLRHTAASHLAMSGVDLLTVGEILGHKDPKVTLRYAHLSRPHLQEAIDKLNFTKARSEDTQKCP